MIIGLTGYAGSGKSTVAKLLVEHHGFTLVKFAGPLKNMMRCLGLGDREIEGELKEQPHRVLNDKTPRYAMQTLGTEWGRDLIGQNLWVDVAMQSVAAVLDLGGRVVIDDVRFHNEALAIWNLDGTVMQVERPGVGPVNDHSSEKMPFPPDWHIDNAGTLEDLRNYMAGAVHLLEDELR